MTAHETPDELRARLDALAEAAGEGPWRYWTPGTGGAPGGIWAGDTSGGANVLVSHNADPDDLAFIVALVNAWPAIDALLARLTAAEADADRLAAYGRSLRKARFALCNMDEPPIRPDEALALHDEALALRERS